MTPRALSDTDVAERLADAARPTNPRQQVVNAERNRQHDPFQVAIEAVNKLRINLDARFVELSFGGAVNGSDVVFLDIASAHLRLSARFNRRLAHYAYTPGMGSSPD